MKLRMRVGVAFAGCLIAAALTACSQGENGRIDGQMFVPPGLAGNAQWGDVWLIRDLDVVRGEIVEHERLLVPALLGKDADFLRREQTAIRDLAVIRAKLETLAAGSIPTTVSVPPAVNVTPVTVLDSLIAGIRVSSRPAEPGSEGDIVRMRRALKDTALAMRERMQPAIELLMAARADQKRSLLADAEEIIAQHRVRSAPVGMDGKFSLEKVPAGDYGIYGRYDLMQWYVLSPTHVLSGRVAYQELPRLSGVILESRALLGVEALVMQIQRS